MVEIKAVIFDYGGVLMDWNPYYLLRKLLPNDTEIARFLEEINFSYWNYECDKGYPFAQVVEELSQKFPHRAEVIHQFDVRWLETIGGVFSGTEEILKSLKSREFPIYGLSNWSDEKFDLVRPKYEFFNWFNDMVISGKEKVAKPDPAIYQLLLSRNHLDPRECIYIDDSETNIRTGRQLGLNCVQYQSSGQLREALAGFGLSLSQ